MSAEFPRIKQLLAHGEAGARVTARGWARTVRKSKAVAFVQLNDGSCMANLQIVVSADNPAFERVRKLGTGSCLSIVGTLVESPGKGQRVELKADEVTILGEAGGDFVLQKKRHGFDFLRTLPHLRPRTNTFGAVFRVRSRLAYAIHNFFQQRGFVYVHTPIVTGADAEGAGEMFRVTTLPLGAPPRTEGGDIDFGQDFFGKETNLTVSGQLEGEMFALALTDIYTFGPTFRAENSHTARHASEFWMIEPECAFYTLEDNIRLARDFVVYLVQDALEHCAEDLAFFDRFIDKGLLTRLRKLVESEFAVITYRDAMKRLEQAMEEGVKFEFKPGWGADLQTEHERYLCEQVFDGPVFVIDWPAEIKAFYMRQNDDGETVGAMDLLVPGPGELIGGSAREERLDRLEAAIQRFDLNPDDYGWYLDSRRYGSAPHAGFGLGFERMLMYLTGMANIRDVIPFPRTPGNAL